jgi:hypothetical protein
MKFPANSLLAGNFGLRDEFAHDCLLQRRVHCEPDDVERDLIRTSTAEGRSRAEAKGQHMGRPPNVQKG